MEKSQTVLGEVELTPASIPALSELRTRAVSAFASQGIPTTKHEEFKYTSLRSLSAMNLRRAKTATVTSSDIDEFSYGVTDPIRIVLINGRWDAEHTTELMPVEGLSVRMLGCALDKEPSLLENLGARVKLDEFPFGALNTAGFEDVIFFHLLENSKIDRPIEILHLLVSEETPTICFPRIVIIAESGSQANIVETYATIGSGVGVVCPVSETFVHPNAQLEHIKVQRENLKAVHIALSEVLQERDSSYNNFSVTYGGQLTRNDLNVFLNGSNIHSRMDGIVAIAGEQLADNHTRLDHAFAHCDSFEVYKHVLDDHSTAVFNGKIYVHQDAQKTDAKQTNQTLLLSPTATINSKPQLEIFADDVKCTHGATIGQMRDDALFYLRSRGISKDQATSMLVYAFAAEVLEKITCEPVKVRLEELLYKKLGEKF